MKNIFPAVVSAISRHRESFDLAACFAGKRVVLLGPCSELDDPLLEQVRQADILAVVNKGHRVPLFHELRPHVRRAVLFHCLNEEENGGGGVYDTHDLRKKGISVMVYAQYRGPDDPKIAEFHRKNWAMLSFYRLLQESYDELVASVMGFRPNTGYGAIWSMAKSGCAHLYVSGITFMRTPYKADYDPNKTDFRQMVANVEKARNHNPDCDLKSFCSLLKQYPITCDAALADIVSREWSPAFYIAGDGAATPKKQSVK